MILAASALKGARLLRHGVPARSRAALAAGAVSAFLSTLASAGLLRRRSRTGRALWPFAVYRCLLAGARHSPSATRAVATMAILGTVIGGRYRLDAEIGRGGMSTVYRAFDTVLERPVAIKLMHREIAADSDQLERFRREARSVAQLNHPHVVTVIDAGEEPSPEAWRAPRRTDRHPLHRARVRRRRDAQGR